MVGCGSPSADVGVGGAGGASTAGSGGSTAGSGGWPGGGTSGGAADPVLPIDGRWAMFSFEDPVAVELYQEAGSLSGLGCYGGFPTPKLPELSNACRSLSGTVDGRHVQFAFAAENFTYAAKIYASADGQRMSGDFHDTSTWRASAFTWLRIGLDQPWLQRSGQSTATSLALEERSGRYGLEGLVDHYGQLGYIALYGHLGTIASSLGAFWETELTWNEAEQTLVAGPVAETGPDLATKLVLHFAGHTLVSVEAVLPSGNVSTFRAVSSVQ